MGDTQLTLTADERQYLTELLEGTLKAMRVEEHRTRTPSFREHILKQESIVAALLTKLGTPAA
jgi:hypothetical protein